VTRYTGNEPINIDPANVLEFRHGRDPDERIAELEAFGHVLATLTTNLPTSSDKQRMLDAIKVNAQAILAKSTVT
jgi:hypothetical protein